MTTSNTANKIAAVLLSEMIVARPDFNEDFVALERIVTETFLIGSTPLALDTEILEGLLRYADVLSNSTEPLHRELAYSTIALLREYDELVGMPDQLQNRVLAVSEAVLIELGNFPGLRTLQKEGGSKFSLPLSRGTLRAAKEVFQVTKRGGQVFTDTQYKIAERMHGEDYFSFSGPTSLGKSFILKDALYDIVRHPELDQHCVVVLVPTKALISQTAADLRDLLRDVPEVNVATFPKLPRFLRQKFSRTIFVLTPERLLRYLSKPVRDIDYLIVDEAQKVIAKNDARSSVYYHAIVEATRHFATRLIFASPSIQNPELFLELFGKATNGAMAEQERTVAQQRYFVDLVDRKQYHFSGLNLAPHELERPPVATNPVDLVIGLGGDRKTIVYFNSPAKSADFALELAAKLPKVDDPEMATLIQYVREYIHKDYFLVKTLQHGVAFHHGKMPQEVREKVEEYFSDAKSKLQFVVCTSTLLEGVNLPAKNIFVLNDKHGPANFTKIDFENLAGRAGRLTYDFSGNVICVRAETNRWGDTTRELIARREPVVAESFLVNPPARKKKEYTDIGRVLRGEELPEKTSADARRTIQQYASILILHYLDQQSTPLRTHFLDKVDDGSDLLRKAAGEFKAPPEVLRRSPGILPEYQSKVWELLSQGKIGALIPKDADLGVFETYARALRHLGDLYNWQIEESQGHDPLVPHGQEGYEARLRYWASLMLSWITGDPLNMVIGRAIAYRAEIGTIKYRDHSQTNSLVEERFNADSAKHINIIIEETLRDLEGGLRFRVIGYLENYYDISAQVLGMEPAGVNLANLVEFGSTDPKVVELQEVGFSRGVAIKLLANHSDVLHFAQNGELDSVNDAVLLGRVNLDEEARREAESILLKLPPGATG